MRDRVVERLGKLGAAAVPALSEAARARSGRTLEASAVPALGPVPHSRGVARAAVR